MTDARGPNLSPTPPLPVGPAASGTPRRCNAEPAPQLTAGKLESPFLLEHYDRYLEAQQSYSGPVGGDEQAEFASAVRRRADVSKRLSSVPNQAG